MMNMFAREYSLKEIRRLIDLANRFELVGREIINEYSIDQIQKVYNGIGPDRFSEKFRKFLTNMNHDPLPAVLIHDLQFDKGGSKERFYEVNDELHKNLVILSSCLYSKWNPWRYIQMFRAWYFCKICDKIGFECWNLH